MFMNDDGAGNSEELEAGPRTSPLAVEAVLNESSLFSPQRQGEIAYSEHARLDAVYIPTSGRRATLGTSLKRLLLHAGEVVVLCSDSIPPWAHGHPRVRIVPAIAGAPGFVRYLANPSSQNPSSLVTKRYDLPHKRNLALEDARSRGYGVIALLDDDIALSSEQIVEASRAAGAGQIAGFYVLDYPDVSVVDHIQRLTRKLPARVSMGGNCIFLPPALATGFFPYVYNEDWLFLHMNHLAGVPVRGLGCAGQLSHEPWLDLTRTRFEQFGDIFAHGLKTNMIAGRAAFAGDRAFWSETLDDYRMVLASLLDAPGLGEPMRRAVDEAIGEARLYRADDLIDFRDAMILEWEN